MLPQDKIKPPDPVKDQYLYKIQQGVCLLRIFVLIIFQSLSQKLENTIEMPQSTEYSKLVCEMVARAIKLYCGYY